MLDDCRRDREFAASALQSFMRRTDDDMDRAGALLLAELAVGYLPRRDGK